MERRVMSTISDEHAVWWARIREWAHQRASLWASSLINQKLIIIPIFLYLPFSKRLRGLPESPLRVPNFELRPPVVHICRLLNIINLWIAYSFVLNTYVPLNSSIWPLACSCWKDLYVNFIQKVGLSSTLDPTPTSRHSHFIFKWLIWIFRETHRPNCKAILDWPCQGDNL